MHFYLYENSYFICYFQGALTRGNKAMPAGGGHWLLKECIFVCVQEYLYLYKYLHFYLIFLQFYLWVFGGVNQGGFEGRELEQRQVEGGLTRRLLSVAMNLLRVTHPHWKRPSHSLMIIFFFSFVIKLARVFQICWMHFPFTTYARLTYHLKCSE